MSLVQHHSSKEVDRINLLKLNELFFLANVNILTELLWTKIEIKVHTLLLLWFVIVFQQKSTFEIREYCRVSQCSSEYKLNTFMLDLVPIEYSADNNNFGLPMNAFCTCMSKPPPSPVSMPGGNSIIRLAFSLCVISLSCLVMMFSPSFL